MLIYITILAHLTSMKYRKEGIKMNTLDTLYSRRSIRNYNSEKVDDKDIQEILKTANAAPVGMGKYEDVHLTVIT